MQGKAKHIGFFMSGTPEFIYDERRGLFSYEALRSRLADNRYAVAGFVDINSPIIKLKQLSYEEIYLLLERIKEVHSIHYLYECDLGEKELTTYMQNNLSRLGSDKLLTPREIAKDFLGLLDILFQNPSAKFEMIINKKSNNIQSAEKDPEQIDELSEALFAEFDI